MFRKVYQQVDNDNKQIYEILKALNYEEFAEYEEESELMTYKFELYRWVSLEELFIY